MNAVDTNILARYFLNDDAAQSPTAKNIIEQGVFVSNSVILETVWLLQSRYEQPAKAIAAALSALIEMPNVIVTNADALIWTLQRFGDGADFADMLHLIEATGHEAFLTYDRKLAKQAGANTPIGIRIVGT